MSLFGFVDLGEIDTNYATLKDVQQLATHVLVFLVKSIVNPLSFSLATFATNGATAYQIFPIFWKAVLIGGRWVYSSSGAVPPLYLLVPSVTMSLSALG